MYHLRPARHSDQVSITAIVREAHLYPRHLDWPRFIIAEAHGQVVAVGQVKGHRDGSRELASLAVRPAFRGQGLGSQLCQALIEREAGPLYLWCRERLETFYNRFDFLRATRDDMSPHFRRLYGLAGVAGLVLRRSVLSQLIVMKRGEKL
jgi:N-acetylglutamate synthase-like GNAT family acetyltransferase